MRAPLTWLREYCDPPLEVDGVAERLTMTGTKVEAIDHHGVAAVEHFLVGRVLEVEPHRDADRLKVCKVDLGAEGDGAPATIVCGAPNVRAGQTVAVARPGAVMPDGSELRAAKLRGVVSEGMILAESELGLGDDGAGILVLDDLVLDAEFAPGTPLADLLPIATAVLELEVTPNRPDCLGMYGVARELHAATGAPLSRPQWEEDPGSGGTPAGAEVAVECPELCRRFTARVFEGVSVGSSPPWLRGRLLAAGQRPINNVVDITNYVMLLTGQPLHAFDLDRVAGRRLVVRLARRGEQVQTLDGQTRTLDEHTVLIEDEHGPASIAGLMGGARSEVSAGTRRVLLEACGAGLQEGTIDVAWEPSPPRVLRLREARVRAILGVPVPRERQEQILGRLDFDSQPVADGLGVTVPALRRDDVTREIDLIEEVARVHGLEHIPATLPARRGAAGRLTPAQRVRRAAEDALAGRGLYEVAGWSFAGPELLDQLRLPADDELRDVVRLQNPLSEAHSIMRPTLLGSLLDVARHNAFHNGPDLAIFESGTVFRWAAAGELPEERQQLGALLSGALALRSWRGARGEADFFSAKALLEALLGRLGVRWTVQARRWPFLHPGRSAALLLAGEGAVAGELGFLGELHPLVASAWDLERAAVFCLDADVLARAAPATVAFKAFASVPALRQDLAAAVPDAVTAAEVLQAVRDAAGEMLERVSVFDVYTGEQIGAGRRSLALALSFRAPTETLADADVAPARERIVAALRRLGGELRA